MWHVTHAPLCLTSMCWQPESSVWPSSCFFFSFASLGGILKTRYHLTMSCTACPSAYHSVHSILCNLFWGSMLHLSRQSRCSVLPPTCCLPKLFFFSFFSASATAHSHSVSSNLGPKFDGFSRTKFSLTLPRIQAHKGTANSQVSISSIPSPSIFLLVHLLFLGYPRELDASLDSYPFGNCSSLWIPCMRPDPWPGPNSAQGTVAQTCLLHFHHISI